MIYKGCERKMVVIKNTGSSYFDEAYFILKEQRGNCRLNEIDMIAEANRIVNENTLCGTKELKRSKRPDLISFIAGALSCGGALTMIYFLFM